jgi:hypothetical protein
VKNIWSSEKEETGGWKKLNESVICTLHQAGDQINEDEMSGACSTHSELLQQYIGFWPENLEGTPHGI